MSWESLPAELLVNGAKSTTSVTLNAFSGWIDGYTIVRPSA